MALADAAHAVITAIDELGAWQAIFEVEIHSNIAAASWSRECQSCWSRSSRCSPEKNASATELSKQSPIDPIDGTRPDARARWVKAHEVN